jgi:hypothetical protein
VRVRILRLKGADAGQPAATSGSVTWNLFLHATLLMPP